MARSSWKGPFVQEKIFKSLQQITKKKIFLIKKKDNTIIPEFLNKRVKVYNGHKFLELLITSDMVGHKFGEFVFTRKLHTYKKN